MVEISYWQKAEELTKQAKINLSEAQNLRKKERSNTLFVRGDVITPKFTGKNEKYYLTQAIDLYENAGKEYINNVKISSQQKNFRDVKNSLYNAFNSFQNAYLQAEKLGLAEKQKEIEGEIKKILSTKEKLGIKEEYPIKVKDSFSNLEKKVGNGTEFSFLAIGSFILALLFSVSSLTGYSIANVTTENFRIGGAIFFLIGMVFTFIYLKGKKRF